MSLEYIAITRPRRRRQDMSPKDNEGYWKRLADLASPPQRRSIRVPPGGTPDRERIKQLIADGYTFVHVAKIGWAGGEMGQEWWYERRRR